MTILSVGYPLFPVSADASGGAEQILSYIERALVAAGHRSFVVAAQGSHVSGTLIPTAPPSATIRDADRQAAQEQHRNTIERCLEREAIDLIHFHGLDFYTYVPATNIPMLATLHLPIQWYPPSIFQLTRVQLNGVSHSQTNGRLLPLVANGVDIQRFCPQCAKEDFLLWLGRICPEKGVHIALQLAHELDMRLLVAGPVHPLPAHQHYFQNQVAPLLDHKRQHLGPVAGDIKRNLLSAARCVLVPSTVAETSSLVSMEAISSGTPVVALRSGALPEVIDHGVTGFIVSSVNEMKDAIVQTSSLSPARCREVALARFDSRRMARDYAALYAALLERTAEVMPAVAAPA